MHEDLTIDRNVRDWVFFPLMILIILMNILRQYAHQVPLPRVLPPPRGPHPATAPAHNASGACST